MYVATAIRSMASRHARVRVASGAQPRAELGPRGGARPLGPPSADPRHPVVVAVVAKLGKTFTMPLQRMALVVWAVGASGLDTGALTPADIDGPHLIGAQPPSKAARGLDHALAVLEADLASFARMPGTSVLSAERVGRPAWLTKFLEWLGNIISGTTTPQDAIANAPADACPDITDKCEKLEPLGANDAASNALVPVDAGGEGMIYKIALLPDEDANDGAENRQQEAQRVGKREGDGGLNSDYDFTRDVERVAGYTGRNFLAYKTLFETIIVRALSSPDLFPPALSSCVCASQNGADDWRRVQTDFVVASTLKTASGQAILAPLRRSGL